MEPMSQMMAGPVGGVIVLGGAILILVLAVLWFCLPFAVFGVKPLLRDVLVQQRLTNDYLKELTALQRSAESMPDPSSSHQSPHQTHDAPPLRAVPEPPTPKPVALRIFRKPTGRSEPQL